MQPSYWPPHRSPQSAGTDGQQFVTLHKAPNTARRERKESLSALKSTIKICKPLKMLQRILKIGSINGYHV